MAIIECPSCRMEIVLPVSYDNHESEIKCESCESLLQVDIQNGNPNQINLKQEMSLK